MSKKQAALHPLWTRLLNRRPWFFFCPVCRSQRCLSRPPNPYQFSFIFQILLTTALFVTFLWTRSGWKSLLLALPLWVLFEAVYRWQVRAQLLCPHCGFDAALFLVNPDWAKQRLQLFWDQKKPQEKES